MTRIHRSGNPGMEVGVTPLIVTLNKPLTEFFILFPVTLSTDGLGIWILSEIFFHQRNNNGSTELEGQTVTSPF